MPLSSGPTGDASGGIPASADAARFHDDEARRLCSSDPDAAVAHARAATAIAERIGDEALLAETMQTAGLCMIAVRDLSGALEHYTAAAIHARNAGNLEEAVRSEIGRVHAVLLGGALDQAATMLLDLEPEARRTGVPRMLCAVLNNLGNVFDSLHQPKRAVECFRRALEHARSYNELPSLGLALSNLGAVLATLGELERASDLLGEAIEVYRTIGDRGGEARAAGNLALVLERQGLIDEAIDLHRAALAEFERTGDLENTQTSLGLIAGLEQKRGRLDDAVALLCRALAMSPPGSYDDWTIHAQLSSVYEELGDASRALLHYRQAAGMRQRIDEWINRVALHELQRHVDKNEALRDDEVRELIDQRDRAMSAHVPPTGDDVEGPGLDIQEQAEIVERLRGALGELEASLSQDSRRALEALLDELDSPARRALALQRQLDAGHQAFLQRLSAGFPTLTPAELRVCSLLRSNLSTKEIAQVLNVSERNIESHRYSVRRKLGIDRHQQLATLLAAY